MEQIAISDQTLYPDPISPLIYGDFVELLNDLIPGMWAEKVQDRAFEGCLQPKYLWPARDWTVPRWEAIATGEPRFAHWPDSLADLDPARPKVQFTFDREAPFVGRQSALVRVEGGTDRPFRGGIAQRHIAVRGGQPLRLELFLRGEEPEGSAVQVLLGRDYGAFFRAYARVTFAGVTREWRRYTAEFASPVTDEDATLAITLSRPGSLRVDKVSLMPADAMDGWRPDVVAAIRALNPGIIRFGGSSMIYYPWEKGIGPRERRAPFENHPWGNMEENDVGLHEFLRLCEIVGAQPLLCVNSNSATVAQILGELEYCLGPADAPYGRVRAAMGHPHPFDVRYIQIGNEQRGAAYEQALRDLSQAIRARYPGLVLLASYPSERILIELSDALDFVCPHLYTPYTTAMEAGLRELCATIRKRARNSALKLAITEWNHTGDPALGPGRAWLLTLYNALNAARMLNMYQRLGDMIRIANRSNMTNSICSGILQTTASDLYVTPCYHVQAAYANLAGDRALQVVAGPAEALDLAATRRTADGEVALFAVNPSQGAQRRRLDLAALHLEQPAARVWTLTGPALEAVNSLEDKQNVAPAETTALLDGDRMEYEFPPYSVTILRFR